MIAAKHPYEEARLAALHRYSITETPEQAFDDITRLVSYICDAPVALITLMDRDWQFLKSAVGTPVRKVPIADSLCSHALLAPGLTLVPDTTKDARFLDNPMVTGDPNLRFYAGALLETPDGYPIGTLCVLDFQTRTLTDAQSDALQVLARTVMSLIELQYRYYREKNIAETLQRAMLLPPKNTAFPGLAVETLYEAAWEEATVGGDFFDALRLADGSVALVVGDVSGKGLRAATHTAETKYALRVYLRETASPQDAVTRLNRFLCEQADEDDDTFVALTVATLAPDGTLRVTLAGAESPFVRRVCGKTEQVAHVGLPVGVVPEARYTETTLQLEPGDLLVLLTDGLTEARQGRGEFWGAEGVDAVLQAVGASPSLMAIGETVVREARAFAGGTLRDDVCLLLAQRV